MPIGPLGLVDVTSVVVEVDVVVFFPRAGLACVLSSIVIATSNAMIKTAEVTLVIVTGCELNND